MYFEDVTEGQELPNLQRRIQLIDMVIYAGATWDFHRYHYDQSFAAAAGFRGPFVDGQMLGALLAKQVMQWAGPEAFLRRLSYQLRHMVFADDTIVCRGKVVEARSEAAGGLAVCELSICNQENIEVINQARAMVELPGRPARTTCGS